MVHQAVARQLPVYQTRGHSRNVTEETGVLGGTLHLSYSLNMPGKQFAHAIAPERDDVPVGNESQLSGLPPRLCVFKGLNLAMYEFEELEMNPTSQSLNQSKKIHGANLGREVLLCMTPTRMCATRYRWMFKRNCRK